MSEYTEFLELAEQINKVESEAPILGNSFSTQHLKKNEDLKNTAVKYIVCNMNNPGDVTLAEHIMSKSLQCRGLLIKPGDILVIKEESNFDKNGEYRVAIKYIELLEKEEKE